MFAVSNTAREVRPHMNPLVLHRADPQALRHTDGHYYFTATHPQYDRIVLRRSRTLEGLAEAPESVIWNAHPTGDMAAHIWAPELHRVDGAWYVYFAAAPAEDEWRIRIWVLENPNDDPFEGSWTEKGRVETEWDTFSLDATTFVHKGVQYLAWAQADPTREGHNTAILLSAMANPWTLTSPQTVLSAPELEWECRGHKVNEGPYVITRDGRIHLTYSASATDHHYCVGLLTADAEADLLDPAVWTKSPLPVLATSEANGVYGPGHNSFTVAEDGETDVILYHARSYKEIDGDPLDDPNRHTRMQPFGWNPDGTPDFGVPSADTAKESA
ncbi:glycoside hydrolase family 43 protein [Streptomyces niveiscabiei]|uniref:glycoside hydrolase family 43 protein n=1 Tax=Streptomyces niveiscabiei TaxID=164115 RepID=UPI001F0AAE20|nr:glycoside hydrolase family 43 protein [Streptomyces niveiscabiei]